MRTYNLEPDGVTLNILFKAMVAWEDGVSREQLWDMLRLVGGAGSAGSHLPSGDGTEAQLGPVSDGQPVNVHTTPSHASFTGGSPDPRAEAEANAGAETDPEAESQGESPNGTRAPAPAPARVQPLDPYLDFKHRLAPLYRTFIQGFLARGDRHGAQFVRDLLREAEARANAFKYANVQALAKKKTRERAKIRAEAKAKARAKETATAKADAEVKEQPEVAASLTERD